MIKKQKLMMKLESIKHQKSLNILIILYIIIDITSIKKLNNPGWKIIYNNRENIEEKNWLVVSVLGNSKRGKTHFLQKLSGNNLLCGYQV